MTECFPKLKEQILKNLESVVRNAYPFAAAAKSLQSYPTLCDLIDGSPPGSPVPGILQARILEWVAISFSNAWKWKVKGKSLSRVWLFTTPWTAAYQAPPSMGFSRQKYWRGVPLLSPTFLLRDIDNIVNCWESMKNPIILEPVRILEIKVFPILTLSVTVIDIEAYDQVHLVRYVEPGLHNLRSFHLHWLQWCELHWLVNAMTHKSIGMPKVILWTFKNLSRDITHVAVSFSLNNIVFSKIININQPQLLNTHTHRDWNLTLGVSRNNFERRESRFVSIPLTLTIVNWSLVQNRPYTIDLLSL